MSLARFSYTRVVTRNFLVEIWVALLLFFGFRLTPYENTINQNILDLTMLMSQQYKVKWYRFAINPMNRGAAMIVLYGEGVRK